MKQKSLLGNNIFSVNGLKINNKSFNRDQKYKRSNLQINVNLNVNINGNMNNNNNAFKNKIQV